MVLATSQLSGQHDTGPDYSRRVGLQAGTLTHPGETRPDAGQRAVAAARVATRCYGYRARSYLSSIS